jgi:hypothetical protein
MVLGSIFLDLGTDLEAEECGVGASGTNKMNSHVIQYTEQWNTSCKGLFHIISHSAYHPKLR